MRRLFLAATALAAVSAIPAMAQAPAPGTNPGMAQPGAAATAQGLRLKQLMDRDVYSTDNVEIGEIEDAMFDPASGRITGFVVEIESRLGLREKYVSVTPDQLRLTPGERRVTLNMTREQVAALPGVQLRD